MVSNEAIRLRAVANIVVLGLGMYAYYEHITRLNPELILKVGFGEISENTVRDAATLICIAPPSYTQTCENQFTAVGSVFENRESDWVPSYDATLCRPATGDVYGFSVASPQVPSLFSLGSRYRNTVLLIVNVASFSGERRH